MNTLSEDSDVNEATLSAPGELDKLEIEENLKALTKASGYLRTLLSKRLSTRSVPKLEFHYDSSIERGQQLSDLIDGALAADRKLHGE
jgi:ribosome-binding factor A